VGRDVALRHIAIRSVVVDCCIEWLNRRAAAKATHMAKWDVTGNWTGNYWYDPNPDFKVLPSPVGFTLTARQGWFGRFNGEILDDSVDGIVSDAAVTGRVSRSGLTFWKQYHVFHVWDESGRLVTLRQQIEEANGIRLDEDPSLDPIRYRGVYTESSGLVRGTWEVREYVLQCWSAGHSQAFLMPRYAGEWEMTRESR
jgi:hypothetical protein